MVMVYSGCTRMYSGCTVLYIGCTGSFVQALSLSVCRRAPCFDTDWVCADVRLSGTFGFVQKRHWKMLSSINDGLYSR